MRASEYSIANNAWVVRARFRQGGKHAQAVVDPLPGGVKDVSQVTAEVGLQQEGAFVQAFPENGLIPIEAFSHAQMLATLAAEEKAHGARERLLWTDFGGSGSRTREHLDRFIPAVANEESPVRKEPATDLKCEGGVGKADGRVRRNIASQVQGGCVQRCGCLAESTSNWLAFCRNDWDGVGAGASSNTTWAFVPPIPNELTPARRGSAPAFHDCSLSLT